MIPAGTRFTGPEGASLTNLVPVMEGDLPRHTDWVDETGKNPLPYSPVPAWLTIQVGEALRRA